MRVGGLFAESDQTTPTHSPDEAVRRLIKCLEALRFPSMMEEHFDLQINVHVNVNIAGFDFKTSYNYLF